MDPEVATVPLVNIDFFIQQASQRIDGMLRPIYEVPLKKINEGGVFNYPSPIPYVCSLLASQMIYEQKLQGTDRARSESQKEKEAGAMDTLVAIANGEIILDGIKMRGQRFVRNTLYNAPKSPAESGRTKYGRNP